MPTIRRHGTVLPSPTPPSPPKGDPLVNPAWIDGPAEPFEFNPVTAEWVYRLLSAHRDRELLKDMADGKIPKDLRVLTSNVHGRLKDLDTRLNALAKRRRQYGHEHPRTHPRPRTESTAAPLRGMGNPKTLLWKLKIAVALGGRGAQAKLDAYRAKKSAYQRTYRAQHKVRSHDATEK